MLLTQQLLPVLVAAYITLLIWPKPVQCKKCYALGWLSMALFLLASWICGAFRVTGSGYTWLPETLSLVPLVLLVLSCKGAGCILEDAGVAKLESQKPAEAEKTEE